MVLAITTLANVKLLSKSTDTDDDALLTALINQVSDQAEKFMGRHLQVTDRTDEDYEIEPNKARLLLRGSPIERITSILYSTDGDFTDSQPLESTTYYLRKPIGQVIFRNSAFPLSRGGWVRVSYRGGMAADQAAFQAAFPDIEMAARYEVQNRLNRSAKPDGSTKLVEGAGTLYEKQIDQLSDFGRALATRRRRW